MMVSSLSVAQRLVRSAGRIQAVLSHRAIPALATVAALLLLCWTLAQGTWRVLQPASPATGGCALVIVQGQPEAAFCSGEEVSPGVRLDTVERDRIVIVRNGVREAVFMKDADGAAAAAVPPIVQSVGTDRQL